MTGERIRQSLQDMLEHALEALSFVDGKSRSALDSDRLLNLSLVRLMEILGEAANRIPRDYHRKHPEIDWPDVISFRNRPIHVYDEIDYDILWQVLMDDLPPLIAELQRLLMDDERSSLGEF